MNQKNTGFGRPANKEGRTDVWKTLATMLVGAVGLFSGNAWYGDFSDEGQ